MFLYSLGNGHNQIWCWKEEAWAAWPREKHIYSAVKALRLNNGSQLWLKMWQIRLKIHPRENSQDIFPPWSIRCNRICMWHTKLQWISSGHVLLINNSYLFFWCGKRHENGNIYIYIYIYIYIVLKPRDTLLSCFHMIVVQYHIF